MVDTIDRTKKKKRKSQEYFFNSIKLEINLRISWWDDRA